MKPLVVLSMPTMLAVTVAVIGHVINYQELRDGAMSMAGLFILAAILFNWPQVEPK